MKNFLALNNNFSVAEFNEDGSIKSYRTSRGADTLFPFSAFKKQIHIWQCFQTVQKYASGEFNVTAPYDGVVCYITGGGGTSNISSYLKINDKSQSIKKSDSNNGWLQYAYIYEVEVKKGDNIKAYAKNTAGASWHFLFEIY